MPQLCLKFHKASVLHYKFDKANLCSFFSPRHTTEHTVCCRKRFFFFFACSLLKADGQVLIKNVLVVTVYKCRLRSFWPSIGISWLLFGRVSSHPIHRVPWQGDVQLLHKLLQLLVGIVKSKKNVQVNCTCLHPHTQHHAASP